MQFFLPIHIPKLQPLIRHTDRVMLIGSCFTGHMAARLSGGGLQTLENPHGILFNPASVAGALEACATRRVYHLEDVFQLGELYHSWAHHSDLSHTSADGALSKMNSATAQGHQFLKTADWLVLTLGSAFQYFLTDKADARVYAACGPIKGVANNHRAPAAWFEKKLLDVDEMIEALESALGAAFSLNPGLNVLLTISPVRHARDGIVENNRSKARLIEAVHDLVANHARIQYFPAYELVIDVLRDYRFYDTDLVHPNHAATHYVWEQFREHCIALEAWPAIEAIQSLKTAQAHRPRFPDTAAHQAHVAQCAEKAKAIKALYPYAEI